MRVSITGGTGFLGGYLVRDLLARGADVRVLARRSQRADELQAAGAHIVYGDLADTEALSHAVGDAEVVCHLAALVGSPKKRADYFETDVAGTERLLAACAGGRVGRLVYVSSLAVYGPTNPGEPIDEDTPLDERPQLRDPYAESKIAA
jgi:nucleoside-diphosphate-sugar epimerase